MNISKPFKINLLSSCLIFFLLACSGQSLDQSNDEDGTGTSKVGTVTGNPIMPKSLVFSSVNPEEPTSDPKTKCYPSKEDSAGISSNICKMSPSSFIIGVRAINLIGCGIDVCDSFKSNLTQTHEIYQVGSTEPPQEMVLDNGEVVFPDTEITGEFEASAIQIVADYITFVLPDSPQVAPYLRGVPVQFCTSHSYCGNVLAQIGDMLFASSENTEDYVFYANPSAPGDDNLWINAPRPSLYEFIDPAIAHGTLDGYRPIFPFQKNFDFPAPEGSPYDVVFNLTNIISFTENEADVSKEGVYNLSDGPFKPGLPHVHVGDQD